MPIAQPALAGALAACLALLEMCAARRKAPTIRAVPWILIRLAIDAAVAAFVYPVVVVLLGAAPWFSGAWPMVIAGFGGCAVLRMQLSFRTGPHGLRSVGLAQKYSEMTGKIDDAIDDLGSIAQSEWATRALRRIQVIPPEEMESRIVFYLDSLERFSAKEVEKHRQYIHRVLTDSSAPLQDRYQQIVERLITIGGRRFVRRFARMDKSVDRAPETPSSFVRQRPAAEEAADETSQPRPDAQ